MRRQMDVVDETGATAVIAPVLRTWTAVRPA